MGRFPVQVMLGDWDVENVTRKIILAKKPTAIPEIERVWRDNLGEISRHLRGTKLEHVTDDENVMTLDYPLLPVRRRFWERVLKTIDMTATVSQLRSQLRIIHEAVLATADEPLGTVVSGDFIYNQIATNLLSTAQLPREVFENVKRLSAGDEQARLKGKFLKLIYLINKLPADVASEIGLRATEDVLADLLVTNLYVGSVELRKVLPTLLDELQNKERLVMALPGSNGIEYRLQTRESSAWCDEFRSQEAQLKASPQRVEQKRADLLKSRFEDVLKRVRVTQGKSNEERRLIPSYDEAPPKDFNKNLYLWITDGWQTDDKSVIADAKSKSLEDPTLFAFIPAQRKTDLADAIVALEAARVTLQKKSNPTTEEGRDAQRSMEGRERDTQRQLDQLLDDLIAGVRVFQAGGEEIIEGNDLADRISSVAKFSATRLYNQFDAADHNMWKQVLSSAHNGNLDALKAVGYDQKADKHPACEKILAYISSGKKGAEIRDYFKSPPFGWSRHAIDGSLYVLLTTGDITATDAASKSVDAKSLEHSKIAQTNFKRESINITITQLLKIRQLFSAVGIPYQPKEELTRIPTLLAQLRSQAAKASGLAPAPEAAKLDFIDAIEAQTGNAQLFELFTRCDEITSLYKTWVKTATDIAQRLPIWQQLTELLCYAKVLASYAEIKDQADAIKEQRSLLAEPDPIRPLLVKTTDILRKAVNEKISAFGQVLELQQAQLQADPDWNNLTDIQRADLSAKYNLIAQKVPPLSTPEQLKETLSECDLEHWEDKILALPSQFQAARYAAVQLLKPSAIHVVLPKRTLNNQTELSIWLTEVETLINDKLKKGPVTL
jgi:hypothetical protein